MLYCEACCRLYQEGERCPVCHKDRGREPRPDDICFLTEKGQIESDMLEDVLKQNGVRCMKQSASGAGMAMFTGLLLESFRLFVSYQDLEKAREIEESLLGGSLTEEEDEEEEGAEEDEPDDD